MLPILLLAVPAGFAQLAHAIAFPGPAPTPIVLGLNNKIKARAPQPTAAPELVLPRATNWTATCGWDDDGDDISCNDGYSCVFYEPGNSMVGMAGCVSGDDYQGGGFARSCIGYSEISSASLCDAACWQNSFVERCTDSASPYCQSTTYIDANLQDFACDTDGASTFYTITSTTVTTLDGGAVSTLVLKNQVITGDAVTGWQNLSSSVAGASTTADQDSAGAKTDAATTTTSPTTSSATSGGASTSPTSSSSGSSSNAGAIAGGVVGGVVGLAIVGAVVFFILRHQKMKAQSPPTYAQVPNSVEGGAAGYYDGKNTHELDNTNERVEADGNFIYKKEAPPLDAAAGSPQEMRAVMSPHEAPSPSQVYEIGSSGK